MLTNWINPVSTNPFISEMIRLNLDSFVFPDQLVNIERPVQIALVGVNKTVMPIRDAFYKLDFNSTISIITDLGDVRNNDVSLMTAAYRELIGQGIFPIVLDATINTSLSIANALKVLNMSSNIGIVSPSTAVQNPAYRLISSLLQDDKVDLISFIAYQKHYANPSNQSIPKLDVSGLISLGKLRDDLSDVEPILRSLSTLTFDVGSIRASDSHGLNNQRSIGLFAEEACKILQYACASNQLKSLHITGFDLKDNDTSGAELIATLIWYSINGRDRVISSNKKKDEMTNFLVDLSDINEQLNFWKDETSRQWWIEIPNSRYEENLAPCSEKEYTLASNNIISDRLFHLLGR